MKSIDELRKLKQEKDKLIRDNINDFEKIGRDALSVSDEINAELDRIRKSSDESDAKNKKWWNKFNLNINK